MRLEANEVLEHLRKFVRYGFYRDVGTLKDWKREVAARIDDLNSRLARDRNALNFVGQLQLKSLHAEYLDILGHDGEAATLLESYYRDIGMPQLLPGTSLTLNHLPGNPLKHRRPVDDDVVANWIRQIVWLQMGYAWICMYRRGDYAGALSYLERIMQFLNSELISPKKRNGRGSHGTQSRYFYYRGHCFRSLRLFADALACFSEAQYHAGQRFQEKRDKITEVCRRTSPRSVAEGKTGSPSTAASDENLMKRVAPEKRFAVVSSAHILGGGLGWISIHQGRFKHTEQLCLSAETLLMETGQEPLKLLIRSNRLTAIRRSAEASSREAAAAMMGLLACFRIYRVVADVLGQLRCGFEYVLGHLDYVAYWADPSNEKRSRSLRIIRRWLARLEVLADGTLDRAWEARVHGLKIRFQLISENEVNLTELIRKASSHVVNPRDLPRVAEVELLTGLIYDKGKDYQHALLFLRSALNRSLGQDPVIEAECHLHLAQIYVKLGDPTMALTELAAWEKLKLSIENAYLHRMAENVSKIVDAELAPFVLRFDDDLMRIPDRADHDSGLMAIGIPG